MTKVTGPLCGQVCRLSCALPTPGRQMSCGLVWRKGKLGETPHPLPHPVPPSSGTRPHRQIAPRLLLAEVARAQGGAPPSSRLNLPSALKVPQPSRSPQGWCPTGGKLASRECQENCPRPTPAPRPQRCPAHMPSLWLGLLPPSCCANATLPAQAAATCPLPTHRPVQALPPGLGVGLERPPQGQPNDPPAFQKLLLQH